MFDLLDCFNWRYPGSLARSALTAHRSHPLQRSNKQYLAQLIEWGLVEMREDVPYLTIAGQDAVWKD